MFIHAKNARWTNMNWTSPFSVRTSNCPHKHRGISSARPPYQTTQVIRTFQQQGNPDSLRSPGFRKAARVYRFHTTDMADRIIYKGQQMLANE